jgi:single-stranded-DNA-specific exonuclease
VEEYADAVVRSELLNWEMVEILEKFAPYGEGNKRPRFIVKHFPLMEWRIVGKKEDHVKFTWRNGEDVMEGIGFGLAQLPWLKSFKRGDLVDVLFNLEINEFRGRRMLQLMVRDVAPSGEVKIVTNK